MTLGGFVAAQKTIEAGTESLETASDGAFTASSIASISALSCLASAAASDLGAGFYMSTLVAVGTGAAVSVQYGGTAVLGAKAGALLPVAVPVTLVMVGAGFLAGGFLSPDDKTYGPLPFIAGLFLFCFDESTTGSLKGHEEPVKMTQVKVGDFVKSFTKEKDEYKIGYTKVTNVTKISGKFPSKKIKFIVSMNDH